MPLPSDRHQQRAAPLPLPITPTPPRWRGEAWRAATWPTTAGGSTHRPSLPPALIVAQGLYRTIGYLGNSKAKTTTREALTPKPELAATPAGPAFFALLATIPHERTGILRWAAAAGATLKIPREQISERLAYYLDQLATAGVHLAQRTRYRALLVPTLDSNSGGYFFHIWRDD